MATTSSQLQDKWKTSQRIKHRAWETLPLEAYIEDTSGPQHTAPIHALEAVIADNESYSLVETRSLLKTALSDGVLHRHGNYLRTNSEKYCELITELKGGRS